MGDGFYTFCTSLCAVLIVSSLVKMLAPKDKMNRIMSLVIGVFFLMCMTSPVINLIENFELPEEDNLYSAEAENVSDSYVLKETADYLCIYLKEGLLGEGIDCSEVKVVMAKEAENGIYLDSVCIYLNKYSAEDGIRAKELVKSTLGAEPQIIYLQ